MAAEELTYDDAIALTDAELEEQLSRYRADVSNRLLERSVDEADAEEAEVLMDNLSALVDELIERHAPHVAEMREGRCADLFDDTDLRRRNLEEGLELLRQREAARLIRDALEQ
jgi:hypothetical protein